MWPATRLMSSRPPCVPGRRGEGNPVGPQPRTARLRLWSGEPGAPCRWRPHCQDVSRSAPARPRPPAPAPVRPRRAAGAGFCALPARTRTRRGRPTSRRARTSAEYAPACLRFLVQPSPLAPLCRRRRGQVPLLRAAARPVGPTLPVRRGRERWPAGPQAGNRWLGPAHSRRPPAGRPAAETRRRAGPVQPGSCNWQLGRAINHRRHIPAHLR